MEAKETVMSPHEIAEISFKVGYEQVWKDGIIKHTFNEGKKVGMRVVVEWINTHIADAFPYYAKEEWQAQLKEWKIE